MKSVIFSLAHIFAVVYSIVGQTNQVLNVPLLNGLAENLPKPEFSQEAKDFCAQGIVTIKIEVDENGQVASAEIVNGDPFLRDAALEAVKKAKFRKTPYGGTPLRVNGYIVYNFVPEKKCVIGGIVNKKARSIPKPIILQKIKATGKVEVVIIIDSVTGTVLSTKAISGHPLLRAACAASARNAKFSPAGNLPQVRIRATLVYNFKPDGTIEF